jgi:hypothetical protein
MSSAKVRLHQVQALLRAALLVPFAVALTALTVSCGGSEPRQPDLPRRPEIWVTSLTLDADSKLQYIGKTKDYLITTASTVKDLNGPRRISVGDEIEGIRVGAIRCSFFWTDASYGGEQYMWRGRWGCQAGRSKEEIENSVGPDGEKRFDYLHVSPVSLND